MLEGFERKQSLKISQVMFSSGWGGAERHVVDLCVTLQEYGHDVQLICRPCFVRDHEEYLKRLRNIVTVDARSHWDVIAAHQLKNELRAFGADIVHAHLSRASRLGGQAAKGLGIPAFATTHNLIKPKYLKSIQRFIATTQQQFEHLASTGVTSSSIRWIPNFSMFGVKPPSASNNDRVVFVAYGRFVPKKGFGVLVDAFSQVIERYPQAHLILGGEGDLGESLREQVRDMGLQDKVVFHGWVSDVPEFLSKGTVFVLPSLDEPFGIVLLEAMASAVPVVCTKTAGPLEVLDDQTAWFADIGNSGSLALAMIQCVASQDQREEKVRRASGRYATAYHVDRVVPKIIEFYETALASI